LPYSSDGLWSVSRKTSAFTGACGTFAAPRMRSGTHGLSVGMARCTGMPSPPPKPASTAADSSNLAAMKYGDRRE